MHAQTQNKNISRLLCVDRGPKYHLLAHTTLSLSHTQDSFRTHDLSISGNGEQQPSSICLLTITRFPLLHQPSVCFWGGFCPSLTNHGLTSPPCILIIPLEQSALCINTPPTSHPPFLSSLPSYVSHRQGHCNKGCASEVTAV